MKTNKKEETLIDFHTHTFHSDGVLSPMELVRRAKIEGYRAIGITDHAQSELTDIVFVELPEVGKQVKKGDELCVVESVKSVSEI